MNCMKVTRALVAAVSIAAIAFATGCNPAGTSDNTAQNKASSVFGGSAITLENTNLGEALGQLVTHDPASIISGSGTVPYLPVEQSKLVNGTTPYLTFTFNKEVLKVFGSSLGGGNVAQSQYVFDVNGTILTSKLLSGLPVITGTTVTFNLPSITQTTGTDDDNKTFVAGNKYIVDFYVQTTDGDFGRVTVAFIPTEADLAIGAFGDANISIYGKTTKGAEAYTLYKIDSTRAFYLNKGLPGDHRTPNGQDEQVNHLGIGTTTFNTYETRYGNGSSTSGSDGQYYDSLDALCTSDSRINTKVNLVWTAVENATEYDIYTTDTEGNATNWKYVYTVPETPGLEEYSFDFPINTYPITGYRIVRIVPKNAIMVGSKGEIRLFDEVNPVTSTYDKQMSEDSYVGTASFDNHSHGTAQADGEIVSVGVKNLHVLVQPDYLKEAYKVTNVAGTLTVTTDGLENRQVLPITVAQVQPLVGANDKLFQLGGNAVGVLSSTDQLTVYVHLRCYVSPTVGGSITYSAANTTIKADSLSVTYTDFSGNAMISLANPTSGSKNSGVVIFQEL